MEEELQKIADRYCAADLKRFVDAGMIPCEGAVRSKIESSPELQLAEVMQGQGVDPIQQLLIAGFISSLF